MSKIVKNPRVVADQVDGDTMLCDTGPVEFFRLNSTGAAIWEQCENATIGQIVGELLKAHPAESQQELQRAVEVFVALLVDAGLVELREDSAKDIE